MTATMTRRTFAVCAAAAATFSALGVTLSRDIAQGASQSTENSVYQETRLCEGCSAKCEYTAAVSDDEVVSVLADGFRGQNRGALCALGYSGVRFGFDGSPASFRGEATFGASLEKAMAEWGGWAAPEGDTAKAKVVLWLGRGHVGDSRSASVQKLKAAYGEDAEVFALDAVLGDREARFAHWVPTYPGTELAALLAIARHLVSNSAVATMPATQLDGLGALREQLAPYTSAWAESVSGIESATIDSIAAALASSAPQSHVAVGWIGSLGPSFDNDWETIVAAALVNRLLRNANCAGGILIPDGSIPDDIVWDQVVWRENGLDCPQERFVCLPSADIALCCTASLSEGTKAIAGEYQISSLWINAAEAEALGLADGVEVEVEGDGPILRTTIKATKRIMPGVVLLPRVSGEASSAVSVSIVKVGD